MLFAIYKVLVLWMQGWTWAMLYIGDQVINTSNKGQKAIMKALEHKQEDKDIK